MNTTFAEGGAVSWLAARASLLDWEQLENQSGEYRAGKECGVCGGAMAVSDTGQGKAGKLVSVTQPAFASKSACG